MRTSLAAKSSLQGELFQADAPVAQVPAKRKARSGAFGDNMKLPLHRWFRYSAGFSAEWSRSVVEREIGEKGTVLDPFAGSGTTLLAAQEAGAMCVGLEAHHFVARVAAAKLAWSRVSPTEFLDAAKEMLARARNSNRTGIVSPAPALLVKCYSNEVLRDLNKLKAAFSAMSVSKPTTRLLWLVLTSILRECSHVGTAQWQYVLPNKTKARTNTPFEAFWQKASEFYSDILFAKRKWHGNATILQLDARQASSIGTDRKFDLVITSPPYPNNYDYADATRLEMTFWGEISSWGDLHSTVRHELVCSCSQHSAAERMNLDILLESEALKPIRLELEAVCRQLEDVRETKGGKKTYHTMIAAYFLDLAATWRALRPLMECGSSLHFVIGDSAPYGVYAPCDRWLGELALAAGFKSFGFEKLRDRNTKWKNRKHTVPLKEGILTVRG